MCELGKDRAITIKSSPRPLLRQLTMRPQPMTNSLTTQASTEQILSITTLNYLRKTLVMQVRRSQQKCSQCGGDCTSNVIRWASLPATSLRDRLRPLRLELQRADSQFLFHPCIRPHWKKDVLKMDESLFSKTM